jgi:hypothetical protein
MTRQLEHLEAVLLMRWVRGMEADHPELAFFAAVPNGGKRSRKTAVDLKAEGVRRGVPDYLWPELRGPYVGLAIELKTDTGRPTPEQRAWLAHLRSRGWRAEIARGWEQARDLVLDYLALDAHQLDAAA